jgi:tRNA A-37 threonylcarbamoyl transferase component Bud32
MAGEPQRALRREEPAPPIPGYEIQGFVGRGSSGAVYRARQLAVDREVAIKILHAHLVNESRIVRRLQREARTTARLAHPHIVSAVDMGETDGRWWYAMEFVDGPSLAQRLRSEGRIREREALRLFIPLCEALEHLWENGVVHRDIKPANILIDKTGGARLADLGLAVGEDDPSITGTGGTLGTPHYISPEQAVDPRKADVKSDIWSFGATLYHTVCGRPPFSGESAAEVLSGVLYSRIADPIELEPALSSRLALVLRKCLTRDPTRRYQNPHELLLDLERVRERRAPKIRRRTLDPLEHRGDRPRRVALAAAAGAVGLLVLLAFALPRWLEEPPADGGAAEPEGGPFEALNELEQRHAAAAALPAELLGDLLELGPRVPVRERVRYEELLRAMDADLRRAVRTLRTAVEAEVDGHIHDGDQAAGWRVLSDQLELRCVRATGYGQSGLAAVGVDLAPWRERLERKLDAATETGVDELVALLLDWRNARLSRVEACMEQQDWGRAFEYLRLPDTPELLAEAGFNMNLPPASQEGLLADLAEQFQRRSERLSDDWQRLDRELRDFVVERRTTLEEELRESRPRVAAEAMLRADFERELSGRDLTREKMPAGLSRGALEELESSARTLATLEETLLEADARADQAEVEELAGDALRKRDYGRVLALWEEHRERLVSAPRFASAPALAELERRTDLRVAEARALDALLERVAERLRELDGEPIELRWGSILYSGVRIEVGADPRREGFRANTQGGVLELELAELPSLQLEVFAGFGPEDTLTPDERLTLASFRLHEGRAEDAQRALTSGPLTEVEGAPALGADLSARIAASLERGEQRAGARESEAQSLFEGVLKPDFLRDSPRVAQARVTRLLTEFADTALVKQQRAELQRIRTALEERAPRDAELELERMFLPTHLELPSSAKVRLTYDFGEGRLGAWESGEWVFDGVGFVLGPSATIQGWDQLAVEKGLHFPLRTPLVPDSFVLTLRFEVQQGESPGRLLWLSAGGFQLALCAADLPGSSGPSRHLLGTEEGSTFLQRMLAGEGRSVEGLLVPGRPPRELRLEGYRRSGRCVLYLDDERLASVSLRAPPSDARSIQIRSWGSVRVLSAVLETGR